MAGLAGVAILDNARFALVRARDDAALIAVVHQRRDHCIIRHHRLPLLPGPGSGRATIAQLVRAGQ